MNHNSELILHYIIDCRVLILYSLKDEFDIFSLA